MIHVRRDPREQLVHFAPALRHPGVFQDKPPFKWLVVPAQSKGRLPNDRFSRARHLVRQATIRAQENGNLAPAIRRSQRPAIRPGARQRSTEERKPRPGD
jgi:hypothetical protein